MGKIKQEVEAMLADTGVGPESLSPAMAEQWRACLDRSGISAKEIRLTFSEEEMGGLDDGHKLNRLLLDLMSAGATGPVLYMSGVYWGVALDGDGPSPMWDEEAVAPLALAAVALWAGEQLVEAYLWASVAADSGSHFGSLIRDLVDSGVQYKDFKEEFLSYHTDIVEQHPEPVWDLAIVEARFHLANLVEGE